MTKPKEYRKIKDKKNKRPRTYLLQSTHAKKSNAKKKAARIRSKAPWRARVIKTKRKGKRARYSVYSRYS